MTTEKSKMNLVDLFCGAGGFSLGAHRAGFRVGAAFDIDPILTSSYQHNFPGTRLSLRDISSLDANTVFDAAGGAIDGIFGGPPCQGFSSIGKRNPTDPRRELLYHFFRLVRDIRPSFFIMENVQGLAYRDARDLLEVALDLVREEYSILGPTVLDAADFGAATKRRRLFVIGLHRSKEHPITAADIDALKKPASDVRSAIGDLSAAIPVGIEDGFDLWALPSSEGLPAYAAAMRRPDNRFTGHSATIHTSKVIERFAAVPQGGKDDVGRHPRLSWSGQCPTLRAGTGSDRGSFQSVRPIHPEINRVITVREAARLQGFPDIHRFHPTVWHSFRMIGNSVSPIIAEALFSAVRARLTAPASLYAAE